MRIRPVEERDADAWTAMRGCLWPEAGAEDLASETRAFFAGTSESILATAFVAEDEQGTLTAFIEIALRAFSDGCESMPVPHIEGWYVDPSVRGLGTGRALIEAGEAWARERGFTEMASDAEVGNRASILAHGACGFEEVERLVKFRKTLA